LSQCSSRRVVDAIQNGLTAAIRISNVHSTDRTKRDQVDLRANAFSLTALVAAAALMTALGVYQVWDTIRK